MNKQTAGILSMVGLMGAVAASGPLEVRGDRRRERQQKKAHARRDDHLHGAWLDPDFSPRLAAQRNAQMELDRKLAKARKLEEGRARVAAGVHRRRPIRKFDVITLPGVVTQWG